MNQICIRLMLGISMAAVFAAPVLAQGQRYNHGNITRTINDCEKRTNKFIGVLRQALNDANVRYERKEDLLQSAKALEESMDKAGDSWNRDKDPERASQFVRIAIASAQDINTIMVGRSLNPDAERQWTQVRRDLNRLAKAFNISGMS